MAGNGSNVHHLDGQQKQYPPMVNVLFAIVLAVAVVIVAVAVRLSVAIWP